MTWSQAQAYRPLGTHLRRTAWQAGEWVVQDPEGVWHNALGQQWSPSRADTKASDWALA